MKVNTLKITVLGKPVGKQRPKVFRDSHGHTHGTTPEKTRNYEATIRQIFSAAFPDWIPTEDPISLCMMAYFPIPSSWSKKKKALAVSGDLPYQGTPDADNILKCADALNEIAWKDDKQVVVAHCERYYSEQPRLEIEISKWEPMKHAHWIPDERETGEGSNTYKCSACGEIQMLIEGTPKENGWKYCPNCGADMRGEQDG